MDEEPSSKQSDKPPPSGGARPRPLLTSARGEVVWAFLPSKELSWLIKP